MIDPIVALISSYKEGELIQGTIRSVIGIADYIVICEGRARKNETEGPETEIGYPPLISKIHYFHRDFDTETEKRNWMLDFTKMHLMRNFWILTIDADEILVWGEYLRDWLSVLQPGPNSEENVVPIKRTEMGWTKERGISTDIAASRLVHSSLVLKYLVGCWKIQTPEGKEGFLNHISPAEMQPVYGEPHIHHRPYLRRFDRKELRLSTLDEGDEQKYIRENIGTLCRHENAARKLDRKSKDQTVICPDCHTRLLWENQHWIFAGDKLNGG